MPRLSPRTYGVPLLFTATLACNVSLGGPFETTLDSPTNGSSEGGDAADDAPGDDDDGANDTTGAATSGPADGSTTSSPTDEESSSGDVPPGDTGVFFAMDLAQERADLYGWEFENTELEGVQWTKTWTPDGAEDGGPAIRMAQIPDGGDGSQFSWGWDGHVEAAPPPHGTTRYYRWRILYPEVDNFLALASDDGEPANSSNKLFIISSGGERCRVIVSMQGSRGDGLIQAGIAIDGGDDQMQSDYVFSRGDWLDMQIELRASSDDATPDGGYRVWIDEDDYDAPTLDVQGIVLNPTDWDFVGFGAYNNNLLEEGGVYEYWISAFEGATAFDTAWHADAT
jgi:hypothetical protein